MKILSISTMFPNKVQPNFGIFVRQRLEALNRLCPVRVISPIPYCPLAGRLEKYAYRARVPREEEMGALSVYYPRFFSVPMILKPLDAVFLYLSLLAFCRRLRKEFDFDLIDAHLAYPDGFAAVLLGRYFNKPVTITLRGHDIFALPAYPVRGRQVVWALRKAQHVFSVARALKEGAVKLGIGGEKITVIPNGADRDKFYPLPKEEARRVLGLPSDKKILLSAGHLVVRKGFHHIIEALSLFPGELLREILLVIVGGPGIEGDFSAELRALIDRLRLKERVKMVGARPHNELNLWYNAADLFCLASEHEGYPNVIVESLAAGTPAVASRVWGTPEIIDDPAYGALFDFGRVEALSETLRKALAVRWDKELIAARMAQQTWSGAARRTLSVMEQYIKGE